MNRNMIVSIYENNNLLSKNPTTGLLEDNVLIYHTDSDTIRINLNDFSFYKENIESIFKLNQEKCSIIVKELNNSLEIPIEEMEYHYENNKIEVEYKLVSQEYPLKIEIEIGDEIHEI